MPARTLLAWMATAALWLCAAPASAQVQPYRMNDFGGFRDALPPGTNGRSNLVELAAFLAAGTRPPWNAARPASPATRRASIASSSARRAGSRQPMIGWQNRPTYQQAIEVQGHRPR